jgi:predicted ATPase
MIRKARFENFKGLRAVEVSFDRPLTVLVGPNGSGKTSVLEGIELVIASWSRQNQAVQIGHLKRAGSEEDPLIWCLDESDSGFGICHVRPKPGQRDPGGFLRLSSGAVTSRETRATMDTPFGPIVRPRYLAAEIAKPSVTQQTPPPVGIGGDGLPSLLGYLKLRDDELFDRVEERLCRVIPNVKKLRIDRKTGGSGIAPESLLFDTTFAPKVPADQMSDGTLYILALIVAILGPHRPKTLLIDDIDLRIHPKAQYELVTLLKEFLKEHRDLQIIATSHSPYILDKLEPSEVRVTGLGEDGSVVVARLDEHPAFEKWKSSMSPGEFWSHTGEDWLKKLPRSSPK